MQMNAVIYLHKTSASERVIEMDHCVNGSLSHQDLTHTGCSGDRAGMHLG